MRLPLILLFSCVASILFSQDFVLERSNPVVSIDKSPLSLAWSGGLNNPQPQMIDLDNDGTTELYIFDRQGDKHLAFERTADGQFVYAPELVAFFPERTNNWVVARDFNQDGVIDLFSHSDTLVSGIIVYQGIRRNDGRLAFERLVGNDPLPLIYFPLSSGNRTQIYVSTIDYPEITDADCDGDLDIVTFNIGGGYIDFYQNQSQERGYGNDSLIFILKDNCYGGIYESGISPEVTLASAPGACATPLHGSNETAGARHAGSTLLMLDNNQDGVKELLLGDVSFTEIVLLENGGSCEEAYFDGQILQYPNNDVPVDIVFFPAAFYTDLDQDGKKDFIAAPNQFYNAEDQNVFWFYQNQGQDDAPVPVLVDSQYLVRDMIDLGTGSIPTAFDVNDDGLMDLIVGNRTVFEGTTQLNNSSLHLFINVGTATSPAFELTNTDYLEMRQFLNTSSSFAPAFGDLNGDNRPDAVIGSESGQLFYMPNTSSSGTHTFGAAIYNWMDIDVGQSARPFIVDLNRDGLNDIVIGSRSGRISYFQNQGTASNPMFVADPTAAPNQIQLGGIDTRDTGSSLGYAAPIVIESDGEYLLITGTNKGQLEVYTNIDGNLENDFDLLDYKLGDFRPGFRSGLAVSDFTNNEKLELIIGNGRGGLEFFSSNIPGSTSSSDLQVYSSDFDFSISPNPANQIANIQFSDNETKGKLTVYNIQGQFMFEQPIEANQPNTQIDLTRLPSAVYIVQYSNGQQTSSKRLLVNN